MLLMKTKKTSIKLWSITTFFFNRVEERITKNLARKHEKLYRKDFDKFAKQACSDTLDQERVAPSFDKAEADEYYKNKYSKPVIIDPTNLNWFPGVPEPKVAYDNSTIRPKDIKDILKNKSPNTCPGEDGLLYGILARLPTTHHF